MRALSAIILVSGFLICLTYPHDETENQQSNVQGEATVSEVIVESENTMTARFPVPKGFVRKEYPVESFEKYLLDLPLKDYNAKVKYYDGSEKDNDNIYCGVIDMDIDAVDLQQCADATMRLRGEYLYGQKRYDEIKFNFLSDGKPRYFKDYAKGDYSYKKFRKYMKYIFSYANTRSLENELEQVTDKSDIRAGDIFVVSGSPFGHAVIVMDVVHSKTSDEKRFIVAQSYMPAQETQILLNTEEIKSPWLSTISQAVETPQWNFNWEHLRRFGSNRS